MIIPGLVSVSFRALSVDEIIALAERAGLTAIEWGGDVHVPHGDIKGAAGVRRRMIDAGLSCAAYGSYYRAGESESQTPSFQSVLDSAVALGAPLIRVWAGTRNWEQADDDYRQNVIDDLARICGLAARSGVQVAMEFHGNTLTNSATSTNQILEKVPNLRTLWQPRVGASVEQAAADLRLLLPRLVNIHAFQWTATGQRRPLAEGRPAWAHYLRLAKTSGRDHAVLLEFVVNDSPDQLLADAAVLHQLFRDISCETGVAPVAQ